MADFLTSTHRSKWIFVPQDLKEKYKAANHRAKQMLEKYGATRVDVDLDGSLAYPELQSDAKDNAEKHSRSKPLKIDEEQLLRAFYEFKIQDVCDAFKFPRKIQASTILIQQVSMNRLTCIYTACKAEENHVSAEELGKGIDQDHHVILNNEMISLGFDLIVYSPYRSIDGFINDMEDLHETAKMVADKTMRTEAPLLFSPGQLALAALRRSNEEHQVVDFERYLDSILSRQHPAHPVSELTVFLNAIDQLVNKLVTPTAADMKHIDRKLKYCRDPGSHEKYKKRKHRSKD
ncbi:Cyclin C/H/T/L [Cynara cardunculus var. scolymus]|uniref:Cyclin C/H/T/L n=1 Tax=Cynara cardunculus var. scolymus TaxID=59895 RepID=A0A103YMK6_CYNCS|nr:Cyclin C/H/T/L [Cynara cardunculus var. scolymus]